MTIFSGFTSKTPESLLLDSGAFLKDYDPTTDTWETAKATKLIGATQGGGSFSAVPTIRRIEIDGVKGAAKGLEALDEWVVTLTANVKEVKPEVIAMALTSSKTEDSATPSGYQKITANNEIALTDYIKTIAWVGRLSGSQNPVIIVIKNALCTNGLTLTMADKTEGVVALTFTAHYDPADLETPPFDIYYPKVGGDA